MIVVNTRKYKNDDREQVIDLITKTLFEIFKSKPFDLPDLKNIKKHYFDNKGTFYVAEDEGKIVGTIGVLRENKNVARLSRMYVPSKYRAQGIGQRLLNKIFQFCKNEGYTKMILSTYPEMGPAIRFYKRNGFKKYKKEGTRIFFKKNLKTIQAPA